VWPQKHFRKLFLGLVAVVVALAVSIGISAHQPTAAQTAASKLDQWAVDTASALGNSDPQTVTWVATNFQTAETYFNSWQVPAATSSSIPVYALVVTGGGNFTIAGAGRAGSASPTGPVYVAILRQGNLAWMGGGVDFANTPMPNLSLLGPAETDSVSGMSPMSTAEFDAHYHISVRHVDDARH
jgi:hypothetical protein